jgi:hypothetical protein
VVGEVRVFGVELGLDFIVSKMSYASRQELSFLPFLLEPDLNME